MTAEELKLDAKIKFLLHTSNFSDHRNSTQMDIKIMLGQICPRFVANTRHRLEFPLNRNEMGTFFNIGPVNQQVDEGRVRQSQTVTVR